MKKMKNCVIVLLLAGVICSIPISVNAESNLTERSEEIVEKFAIMMGTSRDEIYNELKKSSEERSIEINEFIQILYEEIISTYPEFDDLSSNTVSTRSTPPDKSGYLLPPVGNGNAYFVQATTFGWSHGHVSYFSDDDKIIEHSGQGLSRKVSRTSSGIKVNLYDSYLKFLGSDDAKGGALVGANRMVGLPYSASLDNKKCWEGVTNCSQLVWCAYQWPGYDVDSNGGIFVSPFDIRESGYFEKIRY